MECYLLSELKVRGYRKGMLSLWLKKGCFGYQNKDQLTKHICRELVRNVAENDSFKEEERSSDDLASNLGEEVSDIFTVLETDEEIRNLEEKEVAIIEEIAGVQRYTKEEVIRGNC